MFVLTDLNRCHWSYPFIPLYLYTLSTLIPNFPITLLPLFPHTTFTMSKAEWRMLNVENRRLTPLRCLTPHGLPTKS